MRLITRSFQTRSFTALLLAAAASTACQRGDVTPTREATSTAARTVAVTEAQASSPATAPQTPPVHATAATATAALQAAASNPTKTEAQGVAATLGEPAQLKRLVMARDVKEREPVALGAGSTQEPVVAFLEFQNSGASDLDVMVTFEHESGTRVGFIELRIPAEKPRYRTWGRTRNIKQAGTWTAIVTSDSGQELARQTFTVS